MILQKGANVYMDKVEVEHSTLFELLANVEFCDFESGQYFRAVAVVSESTGTVVTLERID